MKAAHLRHAILVCVALSSTSNIRAEDASSAAHGTYEYRMPSDATVDEGAGCGVYIGFERAIDNVRGSMYGRVTRERDGTGTLSLFDGSYDLSVGKGFNHPLVLATSSDAASCTVRASVGVGEPFKRGLFSLAKVTFTPEDVMRETPKFVYSVEIPSAYPAEATLANFDRLAAKDCNNVGVPASGLFPRNVEREGNRYCIAVGGRPHDAFVKCVPYRNGSMCRVRAALTAKPEGNTWDLVSEGADFKAAATAIIEN